MEVLKCAHLPHPTLSSCLHCGAYISHSVHLFALKTTRFTSPQISNEPIQLHLTPSKSLPFKTETHFSIHEDTSRAIGQISDRHRWSLRTQAIGIFLCFHYFNKHPERKQPQMFKYQTMCMYLASKVQEHNIPKGLKKFRKECDKCFSLEEYMDLEAEILEDFGFDLNISTFVDLIMCYLTKGVVFSNERPNVEKIQNKVLFLAKEFVRDGSFTRLDQEQLGGYIIYKSRLESQCQEVWNRPIQEYTGINLNKIKQVYKRISGITQETGKGKENIFDCLTPKRILAANNGGIGY